MSNWRDPSPSDYKLPSRKETFDSDIIDEGNKPSGLNKFFFVCKQAALFFFILYCIASLNSIRLQTNNLSESLNEARAQIDSLSRKIVLPYPEISNSRELTKDDIHNLASYHRLDKFPNVDERLLIGSNDIDRFLKEGISEDDLNKKFTILSMVFNEIENGRFVVSDKEELYRLVEKIEKLL